MPRDDATQPVYDPHFHMWDIPNRPNPNLGPAAAERLPTYLAADYARDMATLPAPLRLAAALHVETTVGQMEGGFAIDAVDETRWVRDQLEPDKAARPYGIVAYVHLGRDDAEAVIERQIETAGGRLRGVRMILNHHPNDPDLTWPQVERGDWLASGALRRGMAALARHGLAFDLSCHPHQVEDAVTFLQDFPQVKVVVNHLGFFHDGEDAAHAAVWRQSIDALAGLPNAFMKLSMLWFGGDGYHRDAAKEAQVRERVETVIDAFGCDRCMFASNYPVDKFMGIGLAELYAMFWKWSAGLSDAERMRLFHDTAAVAYGRL